MNIKTLNPWWDHENAIERDKHLMELERSKYVHIPSLLDVDFLGGNTYIIRGPRQIGKTTFLKMLIRKLLKNGIPKEGIFYWTCDNLTNREDLQRLIEDYVEFSKVMGSEPKFIILDEITGIGDWQRSIKFLIDIDLAPDACFILTGSNSMDLKKGSERLPGRRGKHGKDLFLLPLTFREYVRLTDPKFYARNEKKGPAELRYQSSELKVLFERYLNTGGIPLAINEYSDNGEFPPFIYDLYYSWIVGDVIKEGKNEQTLKEVMKGILQTYSTPISWDSLAKRSSVRSHVTIASYIEVLTHIFVIIDCYFFDIGSKKTDHVKNKKLYFYDPFILRVLSEKLNIQVDKEKVIEGIVASNIKSADPMKTIHYTKIKKETDFVIEEDLGIEVKYQTRITSKDQYNRAHFKRFVVLSKDTFQENVVPVHVFLFAKGSEA
ncbi:MAG: ATP-binding protein [Candidatus Thermoplasmatota archaeon]|nr:ATP-binding protein [Candidatus Thermoplasmatota archaeon]